MLTYVSMLKHEPYIDESVRLAVETLLKETDLRWQSVQHMCEHRWIVWQLLLTRCLTFHLTATQPRWLQRLSSVVTVVMESVDCQPVQAQWRSQTTRRACPTTDYAVRWWHGTLHNSFIHQRKPWIVAVPCHAMFLIKNAFNYFAEYFWHDSGGVRPSYAVMRNYCTSWSDISMTMTWQMCAHVHTFRSSYLQ